MLVLIVEILFEIIVSSLNLFVIWVIFSSKCYWEFDIWVFDKMGGIIGKVCFVWIKRKCVYGCNLGFECKIY